MRSMRRGVALGFAVVLAVGLGGCSSEEHEQAVAYDQALAAGETPGKDGFHARLMFYTRTTEKKWERDKDLEFRIRKESEVRARASFENVRPGQTYAVHLVWIRPDGRELFRHYAEATVAAGDSGGYVADVVYKKADNLPYRKLDEQRSKTPSFDVESVFDISRSKNRETGEYLLRLYLDRRLLKEEIVTIVGS
jgi:hypothetical protein